MIHDPEIVFLDEPTAGLDPLNVRELRGMIRDFAGRKTVVLCTHVLSEVEAVCDRVLILDQGRTVLGGKLSELTASVGETAAFEFRVNFAEESDAWQGAPGLLSFESMSAESSGEGSCWRLELDPDVEAPARLAAWLQSRGDRIYEMRRLRQDLEEVFLKVVDGGRRS